MNKNKLIFAFLMGATSLNQAQNTVILPTITLLKKTDAALEGWRQAQNQWFWSQKETQNKVQSNCTELKNTQKELAILLARLTNKDSSLEPKQACNQLTKHTQIVTRCMPPCHLQQNWMEYSLATLATAGGCYALFRFLAPSEIEKAIDQHMRNLNSEIKNAGNVTHVKQLLEKHGIDPNTVASASYKNKCNFLKELLWNQGHCVESFTAYGLEKSIDLITISNRCKKIVACAAIFAVGYKIYKTVSKRQQDTTFAYIKKILIKLQLQFNQDRYTHTPSLVAQGMTIYWLSELKNVSKNIPMADSDSYEKYLENLEDTTLCAEQKITVLDTMLKTLSFLQKA